MPLDLHIGQKGNKELEIDEVIDEATGETLEKVSDYIISQKEADLYARLLVPIIKEWYQDPVNMEAYVEWLEVEAAEGKASAVEELPRARQQLAQMKKA